MGFTVDPIIQKMNPRIVPIRRGSKGPVVPKWTEVQTRVSDLCNDGVFECEDHDAYGIVLDEDMVVIDVDCHEGSENGYSTLQAIVEDGGPDLYDQAELVARTPSGGAHLFFSKRADLKFPKSSKAYPAIDILSKGCQVLGAGSRDNTYFFEKTGNVVPIDEDLLSFVRPSRNETQPHPDLTSVGHNYGDSPLDKFNTSQDGVTILRREMESHGYKFTDKGDGRFTFIRPNKSDYTYSISGTLGRRSSSGNIALRNFSTSDNTFPSDESITIAEAYRLLNNLDRNDLPETLAGLGFASAVHQAGGSIDPFYAELMKGSRIVKDYREKLSADMVSGEELEKKYPTITFTELLKETGDGTRRDYVIDGLLRRGEVMNVIAAPKVGKSFMVYNLAISLSCGKKWMGYSTDKALRVLIADNELHKEELAHRVSKVASAMTADPSDKLQFTILRGSAVDIDGLDRKLDELEASRFDIVVIDAFYRILPKGMSENDNAAMTSIYNKLDRIAEKNNAAIICVHHTSKGNQGDKSVTDVGSGAGAISRASDTHLVIREHQDAGYCVIDAVTRSGKSPAPVTARFEYPLWSLDKDVEPVVKSFVAGRDKKNKEKRDKAQDEKDLILNLLSKEKQPLTKAYIVETTKLKLSSATMSRRMTELKNEGMIEEAKIKGTTTAGWRLVVK